jgi:uncharacterized protein
VALREPGWWATTLIVSATAARITHAVGLITIDTMDRPSPARLVGAICTDLSGLGLAITLAASL